MKTFGTVLVAAALLFVSFTGGAKAVIIDGYPNVCEGGSGVNPDTGVCEDIVNTQDTYFTELYRDQNSCNWENPQATGCIPPDVSRCDGVFNICDFGYGYVSRSPEGICIDGKYLDYSTATCGYPNNWYLTNFAIEAQRFGPYYCDGDVCVDGLPAEAFMCDQIYYYCEFAIIE